ncbi:hypothetical protein HORIV_55680 [Vreelandella olivaria]|uniref:Enhancing lycopene biosynthesis protein 2 n=1 Tax=Vreelandella olivaria TaxID=390919 RepID=A0ABM7GQV3_9GAMM|nr:hypothetical protein HORIV_55680 [Halomonas olivaria]
MTKQVAVILAGCGVYDGSEIYETTLTLLRLDQLGIGYRCFAPDIEQHQVVNHLTQEVVEGSSAMCCWSLPAWRGERSARWRS